MQFYTFPKR